MKSNLCQLYGLVLSFFSIVSVSKELIQQKNNEHFVHLYNTLQYAEKWSLWCSGLCLWVLYGSRNFSNLMLWDPTIILLKRRGLYLSCVFVHVCSVMSDSETLWTITHQAPLSVEFCRQEQWSGLPLHSPGYLPNSGIIFWY